MKVKEDNVKVVLKFNIQKTEIMASSPITSWQIDGETMTDFIFLDFKITEDGDCSHEIKRHFWESGSWDWIYQRHYFVDKGPFSQCYGFASSHVWMWELDYKESWAWSIDGFELWCWRRLLSIPWTTRRSNQSILKEISPGCSLVGLMLKLKLQYFGLLWRGDSFEKTLICERLKAEGEGDDRGWDGWMASLTQWTWF